MISRTACVQRICWSCRAAIAQQRRSGVYAGKRPITSKLAQFRRSYSSDRTATGDKQRIEALISGDREDFETKSGRRRRLRGERRGLDEDLDDAIDWSFEKDPAHPIVTESPKTTERPSELENKDTIEHREHDETPSPIASETVPSNPSSTPELPEIPQPQTFRHELLHHQNLGVAALGRPIDALIIKNPNKMRTTKKPVPTIEEEEAPAPTNLEWEDLMPADEDADASTSRNEVWNNIEELRPIDTSVLRKRDFDKLNSALVQGFTRDQLRSYFEQGQWHQDMQTSQILSYSWMVKQGQWQAAVPIDWSNLKPKQYQATLVMVAKWKLEILEHIEGLGRTPVWLQPHIFQLVARPSSPVLASLKANLLDASNHERITTNSDESRLNIYTRKSTASVVITRIDEILQSLQSRTVSTEHIEEDYLLPPVLEELGRITDTAIRYDKGDSKLVITWIANDTQRAAMTSEDAVTPGDSSTEDPVDIVSRLIMKPSADMSASTTKPVTILKGGKTKKGSFVSYNREKRSMSWRDKLRDWSRLVSPIDKSSHHVAKPLHLQDAVPLQTSSATSSATTKNRISAAFGHVLHAESASQTTSTSKKRRILSPVIPHPAALTSITADNQNPITQKTSIILNFAIEPTCAEEHDAAPAYVRLQLPVNPDDDLSNFTLPPNSTLEGCAPTEFTDVLLPSESVDVRISQQDVTTLDVEQQSLKQFMSNSEFNLLEGRLLTPPGAQFSVPLTTNQTEPVGNVELSYRFIGLQIHQTADIEWLGHTLRYNSIEAGQHGGQRQELSLMYGAPNQPAELPDSYQAAQFLDLVGDVAAGKHFSWQEGYKLMHERSHEVFDLDLLDEDDVDSDLENAEREVEGDDGNAVTIEQPGDHDSFDDIANAPPDEFTSSPVSETRRDAGKDEASTDMPDGSDGDIPGEDQPTSDSQTSSGEHSSPETDGSR